MESCPDHPASGIDPKKPLLIVDVDEVLALFLQGFGRFIETRGYELRLDRFALFEIIFRQGETCHASLDEGRMLYDDFFRIGADEVEPAPYAAQSLRRIAEDANLIILTNAPEHGRSARAGWLARHGMDYPLLFNTGLKGPVVAALAARTERPAAFVDDLLMNLNSSAEAAPAVMRFQHVADPRLQPLAPTAPDQHRRIDHWPTLAEAILETLGAVKP